MSTAAAITPRLRVAIFHAESGNYRFLKYTLERMFGRVPYNIAIQEESHAFVHINLTDAQRDRYRQLIDRESRHELLAEEIDELRGFRQVSGARQLT